MESQLGWHPDEDTKMSYAPRFRAPGGHIFDVVAQILKKHTCIYSHACTACSIGTTYEFVDLKVSN